LIAIVVAFEHEDFDDGTAAVHGRWDIMGPVVDGNCGGGANNTRLALCFFSGGWLQTRRIDFQGGEILSFFLRAGNFETAGDELCGRVQQPGQEMHMEVSTDAGQSFKSIRVFDLYEWDYPGWIFCEEKIPAGIKGQGILRWRFEGNQETTGNHFYYIDQIRMVKGAKSLMPPDNEAEEYLVSTTKEQLKHDRYHTDRIGVASGH